MTTTRDQLIQLRSLRREAQIHYSRAEEYFERATRGMSVHAATNYGGTGRCPLTDYTMSYSGEKDKARAASEAGDIIRRQISAELRTLTDDQQRVLLLFYDRGKSWLEISNQLNVSIEVPKTLHRQALAALKYR